MTGTKLILLDKPDLIAAKAIRAQQHCIMGSKDQLCIVGVCLRIVKPLDQRAGHQWVEAGVQFIHNYNLSQPQRI